MSNIECVSASVQSIKGPKLRWQTHLDVAKMAYAEGFYAAATRNYARAIKIAESIDCPEAEMSPLLLGLGLSYCRLKRYKEAEDLFRRVIQLDRDKVGNASFDLATHLSEAAVLYQQTGNLPAAENLLRQASGMLEQTNCNDIDRTKVLKSLALVCCKAGKLDEAESLIHRAQCLMDTQAARQTKLFAEILGVVALVQVKRCHLLEAADTVSKAIEILEIATGGQHPELADFLEYAADIFSDAGCSERAVPLKLRAKSLRALVKLKDQ